MLHRTHVIIEKEAEIYNTKFRSEYAMYYKIFSGVSTQKGYQKRMEKVKTDMREINRSIEKSIEKTRTLASLEEVLEEEYYRREDSFSPFGLDDIDLESLFRDND